MSDIILSSEKTLRIQELITAFILSQDVKPTSKRQYERCLRQYFAWIDRKSFDLSTVTRIEILQYKQDLLAAGMSALTVGAYLCSVRKFYECAESLKIYPNVAKNVKSPKRKNAFRKGVLTPEQSRTLLTHFRGQSLRDFAVVNLLLRTGLRTIEVVRANIEDIKIKGGQRVLMVQGKGRTPKNRS